jgi:hypothetical protein
MSPHLAPFAFSLTFSHLRRTLWYFPTTSVSADSSFLSSGIVSPQLLTDTLPLTLRMSLQASMEFLQMGYTTNERQDWDWRVRRPAFDEGGVAVGWLRFGDVYAQGNPLPLLEMALLRVVRWNRVSGRPLQRVGLSIPKHVVSTSGRSRANNAALTVHNHPS